MAGSQNSLEWVEWCEWLEAKVYGTPYVSTPTFCVVCFASEQKYRLLCLVTNACLCQSAITGMFHLMARQLKHEVCGGFRKEKGGGRGGRGKRGGREQRGLYR